MRLPGQPRDDAGPVADRGGRRGSKRMPGLVARNRHRPSARQDIDSVRQTVRGKTVRRLRQDAAEVRILEAAGRVRQDCHVAEGIRGRIHRRGRNRIGGGRVRKPEDIAEAEAVRVHVDVQDACVRAVPQQGHAAGLDSVLARGGQACKGRRTQRLKDCNGVWSGQIHGGFQRGRPRRHNIGHCPRIAGVARLPAAGVIAYSLLQGDRVLTCRILTRQNLTPRVNLRLDNVFSGGEDKCAYTTTR